MKLFMLSILHMSGEEPTTLSTASDLSSFSFFTRTSIGEVMAFVGNTIAKKMQPGMREKVQEQSNFAYVYYRGGEEKLAAIVFADGDYPERAAWSLLNKVLDIFTSKIPTSSYSSPSTIDFPDIKTYLEMYQDPVKAEPIMRVQKELDETMEVVRKTFDQVLERQEKLDDLMARSGKLSQQSQLFLRQAKKQNSCCTIM